MTKHQDEETTFQVVRSDGGIYEVTKQGFEEWLISYSEGDKRFFGTKTEVKAIVKKMIKEYEDEHQPD
jgi:hypothetical protein